MTDLSTRQLAGGSVAIRTIRGELVLARDEQIRCVVAMVDSVPARGLADTLIAPLRGRLAQIRPPRPISFGRLLCLPLNAVIIPAAKWRRDSLAIPRTALAPLIHQVHQGNPELVAVVEALMAGGSSEDRALVLRAGRVLWPQAAQTLETGGPPADWSKATGLPNTDHRAIQRLVSLVLSEAVGIEVQAQRAGGPEDDVLEQMLQRGAAAGGEALGVLLTTLLARLPGVSRLLALAGSMPPPAAGVTGRAVADRAIEFVLDSIEGVAPASLDAPVSLNELRRAVHLLSELQDQARDRPSRATRINSVRHQIDMSCRNRFEATLQTDILARLDSVPGSDPAEVDGLEAAARELRRFEHLARRIGNPDHYDRLLRRTANLLAPRSGDDRMARMDRLRLTEILLGPEQAFALLAAEHATSPATSHAPGA